MPLVCLLSGPSANTLLQVSPVKSYMRQLYVPPFWPNDKSLTASLISYFDVLNFTLTSQALLMLKIAISLSN